MYKKIVIILLLSEIIGIIYAVMLGVIVTILSFALCIGQLTKKSSLPVPSSPPEDADSSVETRNPEKSHS
uniref:Glycophorin-A n=1 Tax=Ailuropoda melanoleuca TaxID=9646 RepID=A0A7N5K0Z8_AILME